jgi:alpha-beta hydrolase superfamily lysophospholipase
MLGLAVMAACAPLRQGAYTPGAGFAGPSFAEPVFTSFDGAPLGLTVWSPPEGVAPWAVIVGVHGMNDYANAFHLAAPWWAERGVVTYAYDQRGFGRSPHRGIWPEPEVMRADLATAVEVARAAHPEAILAVVGISMGGAVAMTLFGGPEPRQGVDRLVLSGPGLRGWGALPWSYRASLSLSSHVRRDWVVVPPRVVVRNIMPSDNIAMLRRMGADPLSLHNNRIDTVHGVVSMMEDAHRAAANLPPRTLVLYGAKDQVIPEAGVKRTTPLLPGHVRTAYYPEGYHMLLRDLQAERVWADVLAFLRDADAPLPSGVGELPWRLRRLDQPLAEARASSNSSP